MRQVVDLIIVAAMDAVILVLKHVNDELLLSLHIHQLLLLCDQGLAFRLALILQLVLL